MIECGLTFGFPHIQEWWPQLLGAHEHSDLLCLEVTVLSWSSLPLDSSSVMVAERWEGNLIQMFQM